jgi:hypothetical protein
MHRFHSPALALLFGLTLGKALAWAEPAPPPGDAVSPAIVRVAGESFDRQQLIATLSFLPPATLQRIRSEDNYARIFAVRWFQNALLAKAAEADGFVSKTPGLASAARAEADDLIAQQYAQVLVDSAIPPTDTEIEQSYKLNKAQCIIAARYHLARIVVVVGARASDKEVEGARVRIDAIKARLDKGDPFATVADELSDVGGRGPGGDYGWFPEDQLAGDPDAAKIKTLAAGQTSDVLRTPRGFEIIKVVERQEPKQRTFAECKDAIARHITNQYRKTTLQQKADQLVKRYDAALNLDAFIAAARAVPARPAGEEGEAGNAP